MHYKIKLYILDIDECTDLLHDCDQNCTNKDCSDGMYECSCSNGYVLGSDEHTCIGKPIVINIVFIHLT